MKYSIGGILPLYCAYVIESDAVFGIMNAVLGTASVPGMLLAPLLAKVLGKRKCLIFFNVLRAGFTLLMLFAGNNPVLFLGALYLSTLAIGNNS